jgi:hypothetical protein
MSGNEILGLVMLLLMVLVIFVGSSISPSSRPSG